LGNGGRLGFLCFLIDNHYYIYIKVFSREVVDGVELFLEDFLSDDDE
jgi:hypothetical protein